MDGIALLCNLHAGGPQTLRRLRSAGFRRLEELGALDEVELADLIEVSPVAARRFAREARLLAQRLLEEPPEDAPRPLAPREPLVELLPGPRLQPIPSRPVDAVEHARVPVRGTHQPPAAPRQRAPDALLRPGLLEGLSSRVCERLIGQGVRTLEDLLRTANLNLARRIALSYPKLLDLTYEARKHLEGSPSAPPPAREAGAAGPFA